MDIIANQKRNLTEPIEIVINRMEEILKKLKFITDEVSNEIKAIEKESANLKEFSVKIKTIRNDIIKTNSELYHIRGIMEYDIMHNKN